MILAFFSTNENYVIYRDINTGDVATRQLSLHLPSFLCLSSVRSTCSTAIKGATSFSPKRKRLRIHRVLMSA